MRAYRNKLERINRFISSIRCEPMFAIINDAAFALHVCKRSLSPVTLTDCESCALCDDLTESDIIIIGE